MSNVFVSYRRSDCQDIAQRICDRLKFKFGEQNIFIDVDNIPYGEDFREALSKKVESCQVLIAMIGTAWLTALDPTTGQRRIDQADDFVRIEIETALSRKIPVIPVKVHDADIPTAQQLPEELQELAYRQGLEIRPDPQFTDDVNRLAKRVDEIIEKAEAAKVAGSLVEEDATTIVPSTPQDTEPQNAGGDLPGEVDKPVQPEEREPYLSGTRQPVLDLIAPTYLLDVSYHFMDWNPAFETVIAKPLGLMRSQHAGKFIDSLQNANDVRQRSKERFKPGELPLVDIEELVFASDEYGTIRFQKIASQIPDVDGHLRAWCVTLNVLEVDQAEKFWGDIEHELTRNIHWSRYAETYDTILTHFQEYNDLIRYVASMADHSPLVADIGAGTGNCSLELLRASPDREVYAVESNESMLEGFRRKLRKESQDMQDRSILIKGDALRMDFDDSFFDAVTAVNVLYTIEDRPALLREIYRVLRPGGILALSTPYSETDVDKLFKQLRKRLIEQNMYQAYEGAYRTAYDRNKAMLELIQRDDLQTIEEQIESCGFEIENADWTTPTYVDAVVVIKARRH